MSLVGKSLWYIESHRSDALSLHGLADWAGVTHYHLARVFAETTGQPVMRHVWRRHLTRAAEALAYGQASVLTIALDAGYASPEAFSRAFRAEFGLPPTQLRRKASLDHLSLFSPVQPRSIMETRLTAPKFETFATRRFAGPVQTYTMQTRSAIPSQWMAYNQDGRRIAGAVPGDYYGLVFNYSDDQASFDYLCGQEVPAGADLPAGFGTASIAGRYARFATTGHISTMNAVWAEVYGSWLNRPDLCPRPGPSVEYYPRAFNGQTGDGGFEIWVAVED